MDNIADTEMVDASNDELMKRFDELQTLIEESSSVVSQLDKQPHDQDRIAILIKFAKKSQLQKEKIYDLLVEMNNFFGSR